MLSDNTSQWESISSVDIAIANTPVGELYDTSVVASKEKILDKNSKNYEDEKWALEQKRKMEAKKGIVKLSKEQIEAKNKQLEKENEIRDRVLPKLIKVRFSDPSRDERACSKLLPSRL